MSQLIAEIHVQKLITLAFTADEVQAIFNLLGELPTKSGVYPLLMKIKEQAEPQFKA